MCMGSPSTLATSKWPKDAIYIGHQVELVICSRCPIFCVGIGSSGDMALVQPVTNIFNNLAAAHS